MIYDAFTFFNELDLLELRLSILDPYVDRFILVESEQTFMGQEKLLYYAENKDRFAKWNDKIIHVIAPNIEIKSVPFERHWLCYALIESILQTIGNPEDIAFMSDLDEIWNPDVLEQIDNNSHSLEQLNYSYFLNMRSNEAWTGTLTTKVKNIFVGFNKLNRTAKPFPLPNGGYHFTNMGGKDQVIKKILAYDHGHEINPQWVIDNIEKNMKEGGDYLGRYTNYQGEPWKFWLSEEEWPQFLKDHKEDYKHLCK